MKDTQGKETPLKYRLLHDLVFKIVFGKRPYLFKWLVAQFLGLNAAEIKDFSFLNTEVNSIIVGQKFCRFDLHAKINSFKLIFEVQNKNEYDYPDRILFYWARGFTSELAAGAPYTDLPPVTALSLLGFDLFAGDNWLNSLRLMEESTREVLTYKIHQIFVETNKLPSIDSIDNDPLLLMLCVFKAKTVEDLDAITAKGVPIVNDLVLAYQEVIESQEFGEFAQIRELARIEEALVVGSAVGAANREKDAIIEELKAKNAAAHEEKDAVIEEKDAALKEKDAVIEEKDAALKEKDAALKEQYAEIARLRSLLGQGSGDN
jgi:predicted transposase/invertase (TIGR01784 family)